MRTALNCVALVGAEIRFSPLSRERVTWPTALVTCKSKGAELAYFNNRAEYDQYLNEISIHENSWIGVSRKSSYEESWKTVIGRDIQFQSWARGEPNGRQRGENCVEYSAWHKHWNDQNCLDKNKFSCRFEMTDRCIDFKRVTNDAVDWNTAKYKCKEAGGVLAYFENPSEYDQFSRQMELAGSNEWLGIERSSSDGWSTAKGTKNMFFLWMTAADKQRLGFKGTDEPSNMGGKENCVEYRGIHKKWNDVPCENKNRFACRFDTC